MNSKPVLEIYDTDRRLETIKEEITAGLTAPDQKYIPCKYFYDDNGSDLFERICCLPEYYPTRTELSILKKSAVQIMKQMERGAMIELGSGSKRKISLFLEAAGERLPFIEYMPVDISAAALENAAQDLLASYPGLNITPVAADFTAPEFYGMLEETASGQDK